MSFNPYSKVKDVNDTKMSNNEAFLAFLSKNDDDELSFLIMCGQP